MPSTLSTRAGVWSCGAEGGEKERAKRQAVLAKLRAQLTGPQPVRALRARHRIASRPSPRHNSP